MKDAWIYTCEVEHECGPYLVSALICADGIRECLCGKPMIPMDVYEFMIERGLGLSKTVAREQLQKLYITDVNNTKEDDGSRKG